MQCITLDDTSLFSGHSSGQEDSIDALINAISPPPASGLISATADRNIPTSELVVSSSAESSNGEPIYAVVDLKKKNERRAARLNKFALANQSPSSTSSLSPENVNRTANASVEKPPSPGYSYIRHFCDQNNNRAEVVVVGDEKNGQRVSSKIRSATVGAEGGAKAVFDERPKSCQLYSTDYEEVKLENQLFMRDYNY